MTDAPGLARNTDPSTSHVAADEVDTQRLNRIAWAALKADGRWLTYFEWSKVSGIKYASITPRGKALCRSGRVIREKKLGFNDLGVFKMLLHFKAV